jgi:hypothetical protein
MLTSLQTTISGDTHDALSSVSATLESPTPTPIISEEVHSGSAATVQNCDEFCEDPCVPNIMQQNSRRPMVAVIVLLLMSGLALRATLPCFDVSDKLQHPTQPDFMTHASFDQQESQHGFMNHATPPPALGHLSNPGRPVGKEIMTHAPGHTAMSL